MSNVEQWEHNEQRAMETEITTLREQVEKLTEESVVLRASSRSKLETIANLEWQVGKLTEDCVVLRASNRTKLDTIAYLETMEDENQQKLAALTKERDAEISRNKPLRALISSLEETKSILLKKSAENKEAVTQLDSERQANAALTEELAALAEQNEKFRKLLPYCNTGRYGYSIQQMYFEVAQLPDLASPVLNRIRAETLNQAAKWFNDNVDNRTDTWQAQELRRMAAELEKTK